MDYNNMEVVMIGTDQNMPDEKMPAKLIKVIEKSDKKNHMRIKIIHPNKDSDGNREVLYDKVHRFSPEKEDPMELFLLAQKKGDELIETQFANVETTHEDIKFIPAYKTGFMKMNTKKSKEADDSNKSNKKKTPAKKTTKKVSKKAPVKKTTKKKVAKKTPAKKTTKKKVAKKTPSKKVTKKKISKKVAKKVTKKKVTKKVAKKSNSKANSRRKKVKK